MKILLKPLILKPSALRTPNSALNQSSALNRARNQIAHRLLRIFPFVKHRVNFINDRCCDFFLFRQPVRGTRRGITFRQFRMRCLDRFNVFAATEPLAQIAIAALLWKNRSASDRPGRSNRRTSPPAHRTPRPAGEFPTTPASPDRPSCCRRSRVRRSRPRRRQ